MWLSPIQRPRDRDLAGYMLVWSGLRDASRSPPTQKAVF
ncbi:hypothetical protein RB2083_1602 [Rhodobacteraceae bacterium HTCC2083]|nr:hypothetical protein RB2083_1602 [Rhodobacteraceae bacterium HTCC2083]